MNTLRDALQEYLQLRRALGFKLEREGVRLPQFVSFLEQQGATHITTSLAVRWAMTTSTASPGQWGQRLGEVRLFARFIAAQDDYTEVPPCDLLPRVPSRKLVPFVYSDTDLIALMRATDMFEGIKRDTYTTLLGLLAATGMRVGEAISLDRVDINWRAQLLVIRHGKFGKSRELALHPTTMEALRAYERRRDRALPHPRSPALLLSLTGTRLLYNNVYRGFSQLLRRAAIPRRLPRTPRLHDLRQNTECRKMPNGGD